MLRLPPYNKLPFYCPENEDSVVVCGCDPGPTHSALVLLMYGPEMWFRCVGAFYWDNDLLDSMSASSGLLDLKGWGIDTFAYERVGFQGRLVGQTVFDTAAMSGSLRRLFRHEVRVNRIMSYSPSMWRYITTGVGSAKDSDTKAMLADADIEDLDYMIKAEMKRAKRAYRLTKPCGCHLRDAAGVALATFLTEMKVGCDGFKDSVIWERPAYDRR